MRECGGVQHSSWSLKYGSWFGDGECPSCGPQSCAGSSPNTSEPLSDLVPLSRVVRRRHGGREPQRQLCWNYDPPMHKRVGRRGLWRDIGVREGGCQALARPRPRRSVGRSSGPGGPPIGFRPANGAETRMDQTLIQVSRIFLGGSFLVELTGCDRTVDRFLQWVFHTLGLFPRTGFSVQIHSARS